jgi:RNA polymerase sigma-70 factor (ECF subfamily)
VSIASEQFAEQVAPLRPGLLLHCYRMLGSSHDADDALQDALLRAWKGLARFEGRSSVRSWLYTVATRTCLDLVEQRGRRALPMDLGPSSDRVVLDNPPLTEIAWLGPYADQPGDSYEQRESVQLAFVAALQHLPGNQRAALLLFEVLDFSAAEIAEMMATSTASVNSALQRARRVITEKVPAVSQQSIQRELGDARVRDIVTQYSTALEQGDSESFIALLTKDVTWSMPPLGHWYAGIEAAASFSVVPLTMCPSWQHRTVTMNGQPAVAGYLGVSADSDHFPWSVDVLTLDGDKIAGITSFIDPTLFALLDLPLVLGPIQRIR